MIHDDFRISSDAFRGLLSNKKRQQFRALNDFVQNSVIERYQGAVNSIRKQVVTAFQASDDVHAEDAFNLALEQMNLRLNRFTIDDLQSPDMVINLKTPGEIALNEALSRWEDEDVQANSQPDYITEEPDHVEDSVFTATEEPAKIVEPPKPTNEELYTDPLSKLFNAVGGFTIAVLKGVFIGGVAGVAFFGAKSALKK